MFRILSALAFVLVVELVPAQAQETWVTLTSTIIPRGATGVSFDASLAKGRFKAFRILPKDGAKLDLTKLRIAYSDCHLQEEQRRISVSAGRRSEAIHLQKDDRFIDRIGIELRAPAPRNTTVVVEGLQREAAAAAVRQSMPADRATKVYTASQWLDVGLVLSPEQLWGTFDIDPVQGMQALHACLPQLNTVHLGFDELQMRGLQGDVFVKGLRVTYDNGQVELVTINSEIRQGSSSPKLTLKGSSPIRYAELWFEPSGSRQRARLELHLSESPALDQIKRPRVALRVDEGGPVLSGGSGPNCVSMNTCTPVAIFFGTNRERADKEGRLGFGPARAEALTLGQAIVTVPKPHGVGRIERPSYWHARDIFSGLREDPERHFTIPADGIRLFQSPEQFVSSVLAASKELTDFKDHAFIYVHGFRVEFDDALYRLAQLTYDLGVDRNGKRIPFGLPFLFSWPARGGVLDYVTDTSNARRAEPHLRAFLELVVTQSRAKNVHLIAHSMGNQPLIEVLNQIAQAAHPNVRFNQVILAAPDVDTTDLVDVAERVSALAKNVTLYASSSDEAMYWSRKAHSDIPRAGDVPPEGPLVVKGIHTIDATDLSTEFFWANHSKYADDTYLLEDIGRLFREGIVPPHDRTPILARKRKNELWYWFFPKPRTPFG